MLKLRRREDERPRCPYCHDDLSGALELTGCGGCGASYHRPCAEELRACATVGCPGVLAQGSRDAGPRCEACAGALGEASVWSCEACAATYHSGCGRARVRCTRGDCRGELRAPVVWRTWDHESRPDRVRTSDPERLGVSSMAMLVGIIGCVATIGVFAGYYIDARPRQQGFYGLLLGLSLIVSPLLWLGIAAALMELLDRHG